MDRIIGVHALNNNGIFRFSPRQGNEVDIIEVQKKYEDAVLQLPNVIGMGIGLKDDKPVIKVFVCEKRPENLLKPDEIIPKTLDGYQTDVEDIGIVTTQSI